MKETPIFFKSEMVRAILQGRKTQTRRIIKTFKAPVLTVHNNKEIVDCIKDWDGLPSRVDQAPKNWEICRYGVAGDRLWIRESMRYIALIPGTGRPEKVRVEYCADGAKSDLIPYPKRLRGKPRLGHHLSYGGYREASRITLELVSVRVERLQDISEADVAAEGTPGMISGRYQCMRCNGDGRNLSFPIACPDCKGTGDNPLRHFAMLWNKINAKRGYPWNSKPWVWRLEFKVIDNERRTG